MSQREEAGTASRAGLADVARGSTLNLAGAVISAAATLATTVIVTRHFSRAVAGAFVTAMSLFLIVEAIAGLGAGNGAVYFIARLRPHGASRLPGAKGQSPAGSGRPPGTGPDGRVAAILRAAVRPVLVASVLSAALMLVFAGPLARLLAGGPLARGGSAPGPAAGAIRALAVAVPFAALADTFLGASRGFRNMLPTVVVDRITRPAAQVAGLIAAVAVGRAALLAPLWALPYLPASLAAWLWLRRTRLHPAARPAPALRPDRATAPPVPWAMPAHPSSPPARHWTLSAQPGTPPAGLAPPPTAGTEGRSAQPATRHGQGWPGTPPARPGLQEVPPALAVLLALSRPVPPPSPVTRPPDDHPGAPARPGIPVAPGWTGPVPPPRTRSGSCWGPATQRPGRFPAAATPSPPIPPGPATWAPRVPGQPGDPAKPPPPQTAVPGAPRPADAPPGHAAAPEPAREPITQPFWFPGGPGLPWNEVPPPGVAVPGPPWAPATPPPPGRGLPAPDLAGRDGAGNAAGFWAFTAPRALAAVAQIVLQRLDIVLVAVISGPAQAAVYAAATRFLVAGQLANAALIQAAQPQLSHLFGIGDRAAAGAVYQATTAWLIVLTWPLYLLSALFGPQLLAVFGRSYQDGATVVVILALAMLLATACGQVDLVLTMTGRSRWSLFNGLLAVLVNVAVDVALIPRAGITGAAIGWAAALAVSNLVPLAQVAWVAGIHPFGRGPAAAMAVTAVAFGAVPLAARTALGPGLAASLAGVAAGALLAVAGLWCCRGALRLAALPGRPKAQLTREKVNPSGPGKGRR
jgi:O-antigen/teichoic acid export membrane protein